MSEFLKKRNLDEAFAQATFDATLGLNMDEDLEYLTSFAVECGFPEMPKQDAFLDSCFPDFLPPPARSSLSSETSVSSAEEAESPVRKCSSASVERVATSPNEKLAASRFCHAISNGTCEVDRMQLAGRDLALVATSVDPLWYADRPFPRFVVELRDTSTGQIADDISGWKVVMTVQDGFGQDASTKVYGQVHNHTYTVIDGRVSITGLRFCAVSSKSGGHFTVTVSLCEPQSHSPFVRPFVSDKIQVLSYRLYHAPKVDFEDLKPTDKVGKMKGIGTLYAKRFASMGIKFVAQLAAIDVSKLGDEGCKELLDGLRKDRGAMTLAKLGEYIQQARNIVTRWNESNLQKNTQSESPNDGGFIPVTLTNSVLTLHQPNKKAKIERPEMMMPCQQPEAVMGAYLTDISPLY